MEIKAAGGTEVASQMVLKQQEYPGLSRWVHCQLKGH